MESPPSLCSLPDKKHQKYLSHVVSMLNGHVDHKAFNLHSIQVIHGTLFHVSFVFPDGSSRLPVLSNFMSGYHTNSFITHHLSDSFIKTLLWWKNWLSNPLAFCQLHPVGPLQDHGIYVDASTSWGIGLIISNLWHAFQLVNNWKIPGHNICWLESIALELVIYFLCQLHFTNIHMLIHSNNNMVQLEHTQNVIAKVFPSILVFATLTLSLLNASLSCHTPILNLLPILLTQSCMENRARPCTIFFPGILIC
jgi:hypothetical protein